MSERRECGECRYWPDKTDKPHAKKRPCQHPYVGGLFGLRTPRHFVACRHFKEAPDE